MVTNAMSRAIQVGHPRRCRDARGQCFDFVRKRQWQGLLALDVGDALFERGRGRCAGHAAVGWSPSGYFSLRQFAEARFSIVPDSISMSKPLRSRYFSVSTWPVPSSDTP